MLTILIVIGLLVLGIDPASRPWAFDAAMIGVFLVFGAACIADGDAAEARFLRKDPSQVTADETAGQVLPLVFLPAAAWATTPRTLFTLALAFIAFRVLDILKPWPANRLQRVPGGWGILLDDLVAGFYAAVVIQAAVRV
jgi:phosphatidylglycerophosphatase A